MKIAFLSFYSGEIYRGVETFLHELANRLTELGHNVTVYQNGSALEGAKYKTVSIGLKIDWQEKPLLIPFLNYWSLLIKRFTEEVLKKVDSDTDVIFPGNGQWESVLCKLWAVKNGKKIIISGQSGVGFEDRVNLYTFPDAFVPISSDALKRSRRRNPFVRLAYIPNGVDLKRFKKEGKTYSTKLDKPIVLVVGAFVKAKRIDLIIKAVSGLPEASLLIVGDGPEKESLKNLAETMMPDRYEFLKVKHSQMPEVYRAADVFAFMPVRAEAFGIVYAEAMASGLPAVAPADEQRKEIVGEGGLLIEDSSEPADIAYAIDQALVMNWGNSPRAQAEKFSWDEIAGKYEKLLLEICQK